MEARIMTRHPEHGKQGVNISQQKYDLTHEAIVTSLRERGELTFRNLTEEVKQKLRGKLDGSIPWYVTTVKLDLEARGIIKRIPGSRPQLLRLAGD